MDVCNVADHPGPPVRERGVPTVERFGDFHVEQDCVEGEENVKEAQAHSEVDGEH